MDELSLQARQVASYVCEDSKYRIKTFKYRNLQYASIYFCRLVSLRSVLAAKTRERWPSLPVRTVLDIVEGEECTVIGTLYKSMKLKPSILEEYTRERSHSPLLPLRLTSSHDSLILEDEKGRISLVGGSVHPDAFVTGVVVAVRGYEQPDGDFLAKEILTPGIPDPAVPRPISAPSSGQQFVLLLSGLDFGSSSSLSSLPFLLTTFLAGQTTGHQDTAVSGSIVRLVIAGGSCAMNSAPKEEDTQAEEGPFLSPLRHLDAMLMELGTVLPVDLMPGTADASNIALPQQPLHPCLLPGSSLLPHSPLTLATNPHQFNVGGISFLGTSGQNIDDMRRYSNFSATRESEPEGVTDGVGGGARGGEEGDDGEMEETKEGQEMEDIQEETLELMRLCLEWRHLAPTAPDTLSCYPFQDEDPFLLAQSPHVFFAGNQPAFASSLVESQGGHPVRLVSVPHFAGTGQAVMVNINTLDCSLLSFQDLLRQAE